ncbi:MAG: 50S ribosomal protein L19 [Candidatus Pacebacteria bacterium]|nr:50S ribosomal protein L19 [Candidatus Paceibacterota bacterium]
MAAVTLSTLDRDERKSLAMKSGDTVKVYQKIQEKGKTRLQVFEGLVLARKHGTEAGATFTVRKVSGGYGVEKIFPLYSPLIDKVEVTKHAQVRRSKLYYIRNQAAKEISKRMKIEMAEIRVKAPAKAAKEVAEDEVSSEVAA